MASETFKASRWTSGNLLFRTVIEVTDRAVIRHKRSWFSRDVISISISKVASVHIKTASSVGHPDRIQRRLEPLASHGHAKGDAQSIRTLVEEAQGIGPEKLKLS